MCRFDSSCRFTVFAYYVYNLLTSTGMLDRIIPTIAIIRMYTIRILLPIKRNNWWDIYAHDVAHLQQSTASLRVSVTYTIYTRIYIIFFHPITRVQNILVSLLTFPEHVHDDLVVFLSNIRYCWLHSIYELYTFVFQYIVYNWYLYMSVRTRVITVIHVLSTLLHKLLFDKKTNRGNIN